MRNKAVVLVLVLILRISITIAQPPVISYPSPESYIINNAITSLSPANTGGPVPAAYYGQVSTFAGNGRVGSNDGTGALATLSAALGMAVDANGNLYIADYNNNIIRKIMPGGAVTTIAGDANAHGAVNGPVSVATFALPQGLAIDKAGNIYIADSYNDMIRKVDMGGRVSTFAGTAGIIGAADGKGANASFNSPTDVVIDSTGNLYVTDSNNNMIRQIAPDGTVTTLAGNTTAGLTDGTGASALFNYPVSLTLDPAGNIYVADALNNSIRKISPGGGVSTLAGSGAVGSADGTGAAARFNRPDGITIDDAGTLYVSDEKNNLIRKINAGGVVSTLAGNGSGGSNDGTGDAADFSYPGGIIADGAGNVYVGDINTHLIRRIGITGYTIDKPLPPGLTFDPTKGVISGTPVILSQPTDYTITAYNNFGSSHAVVNIAVTSVNNSSSVLPVAPDISYQTPQTYKVGSAISPLPPVNKGGTVPPNAYGQVTTFAGNGLYSNINGTGKAASFGSPVDLAFDGTGNLYVTEYINNDIRKITPGGVVSAFAGNGSQGEVNGPGNAATFQSPYGIIADVSGNVYVADEGNQAIRKITPDGMVSTFAGNGGPGTANGPVASATFDNPLGLVFDAAGDLSISDRGNSVIRKIDVTGQVSTTASLEPNNGPSDDTQRFLGYLAIDASGTLYVPDNNQIKKIDLAGNISVLAGSISPGFFNGTGTAARFNLLYGVAVDALGNVYAGDSNNNMIRKITPLGIASTLAGNGTAGSSDGIGSTAGFHAPYGVAVDAANSFLYVTDSGNNLIRKIAITGYAIDKSLPTGLAFDTATGIISGTPAVLSPATTYTITAYNTGGSSTSTVNIQVTDNSHSVAFSPIPSKLICDANFDPGATGAGPVTYTSSDTTVATIVSGKIHLIASGTAVITAADSLSQATQTLTVSPAVIPLVSIAPDTIDGCRGDTVTFTATAINGGTDPGYQWQVNGQNAGVNNPLLTSSTLNSNDKITCILTSNATCVTRATVTSNAATFTIDAPVSASVNIKSSALGPVCAGTPVTFVATAITPDKSPAYQWQVNGKNEGVNNPAFTSKNLADGDIVSCALISMGKCLVNPEANSNLIQIELNPVNVCTIMVPNAFTPNGDGINDLWNITGLAGYPACKVNIYTRYGNLVYESTGYPKAWDGTYDGKPLPAGTYYYIIDPQNGVKKIAGFVIILR